MHYIQSMTPQPEPATLVTARLLAVRMERLSADSHWARRASGLRGSLLRSIEEFDLTAPEKQGALLPALEKLNWRSFEILTRAAQEIRPPRPELNLTRREPR